jgi:hypothetical protein
MGAHRFGIGFVIVCAAVGCNRQEKKEAAASATVTAASNDVAIKVSDKPVEKVKVVSALASDKNIDLVLDCEVDCSIFEKAFTPGVAPDGAFEDKCGPNYRYIKIAMNPSGPLKPGTYDQDKFSLGLVDAQNGANLLFDVKTAKLELKSETEGSFETDTGTKGSFKAKRCK